MHNYNLCGAITQHSYIHKCTGEAALIHIHIIIRFRHIELTVTFALVEQRHDRIVTILFQALQHRIAFHLNSLHYYDQALSLSEAERAPWLV